MAIQAMTEKHESPKERLQRRRVRRWKRRARIAGPFLGLPLLVGTLALSVDLITYSPAPTLEKLADQPLPQVAKSTPSARAPMRRTVMSPAAPVLAPEAPASRFELELGFEQDTTPTAAPKPPQALR